MADKIFRVLGNTVKKLIDRGDGTHAERVEAYPPVKLMTDSDGQYARVRVDVAQTSFWASKEFRTFQKFSIAAGASVTIRATVGVNIVLFDTSVYTEDATIEMQLKVGGTASGPWTAMPVIRRNTMSDAPVVTSQVTLDYDGGHTGGTLIDLIRVPANNKGSGISPAASSERGVGPGTYYYVLSNVGNKTATVIYSGRWEERT